MFLGNDLCGNEGVSLLRKSIYMSVLDPQDFSFTLSTMISNTPKSYSSISLGSSVRIKQSDSPENLQQTYSARENYTFLKLNY